MSLFIYYFTHIWNYSESDLCLAWIIWLGLFTFGHSHFR